MTIPKQFDGEPKHILSNKIADSMQAVSSQKIYDKCTNAVNAVLKVVFKSVFFKMTQTKSQTGKEYKSYKIIDIVNGALDGST